MPIIRLIKYTLFFSQSKKNQLYVTLSAKQKQEICQRKAKNPQLSNSELAKDYRVGKTTVQNIIIYNKPYAKRLRNRRPKWQTLEETTIYYTVFMLRFTL